MTLGHLNFLNCVQILEARDLLLAGGSLAFLSGIKVGCSLEGAGLTGGLATSGVRMGEALAVLLQQLTGTRVGVAPEVPWLFLQVPRGDRGSPKDVPFGCAPC